MRLFIVVMVLGLGSLAASAQDDACSNPENPGYARMHSYPVFRSICDQEDQRQNQANAQRRQWEDEQQARSQAAADAEAAQREAMNKAVTHGYRVQRVIDLMLDGKALAGAHAKIQTDGFYRKIDGGERLYASPLDAYTGTDKFIPILTEDAQRPLREKLLGYVCSNPSIGCAVAVGGHIQTCRLLAIQYINYPPMPCLHVEVVIQ